MYVRRALEVAALFLVLGQSASAQSSDDWDPARILLTREQLLEMQARFERAAESQAYTADLRAHAREQAALTRQRLTAGDFQVGDRIWLNVEGESTLADTFIVQSGRVLSLPAIGELSLNGVLRSELQSHLAAAIRQFIRDPVVHAQPLIRIAIFGEVGRPGFYVVPTQVLLTDALMQAGGPTRDGVLTRIWVERDGRSIWGGEPLQEGIIEGRTLDQLSLRAGDRIHVPRKQSFSLRESVRIAAFGLPVIVALSRLLR